MLVNRLQIKFDTTCTCPEIVISSERDATVAKHGSQMGAYTLHGAKSGRPVSAGCEAGTRYAMLYATTLLVVIKWEGRINNELYFCNDF